MGGLLIFIFLQLAKFSTVVMAEWSFRNNFFLPK